MTAWLKFAVLMGISVCLLACVFITGSEEPSSLIPSPASTSSPREMPTEAPTPTPAAGCCAMSAHVSVQMFHRAGAASPRWSNRSRMSPNPMMLP